MLLKRWTRKNFISFNLPPLQDLTLEKKNVKMILFYLYNLIEPILSIDDFQGPKYNSPPTKGEKLQ